MGAGLLLRSLERLFAVNAGFDASNLVTMQVAVSSTSSMPSRNRALNVYASSPFAVALGVGGG